MANKKKRSTKKTVKKVAKKARAVGDTRLSMAAAAKAKAKALDAAAQTITVLNSQSESRAKQKPGAVFKAEVATLQDVVAQLVENGNRLGANADALQQALTATYPRIAAGSHPTKENVKGLVLDKVVGLLSYDSPDGELLDTLARLLGTLS